MKYISVHVSVEMSEVTKYNGGKRKNISIKQVERDSQGTVRKHTMRHRIRAQHLQPKIFCLFVVLRVSNFTLKRSHFFQGLVI